MRPAIVPLSVRWCLVLAALCPGPSGSLCLLGDRLRVEVSYERPGGESGPAVGVPVAETSGYFWFVRAANPEVVVKVADGRSVNGHLWVFLGGLSTLAYTVEVTDLLSGARRTYSHPAGPAASRADLEAFSP